MLPYLSKTEIGIFSKVSSLGILIDMDNNYGGMTVNERLASAGLMQAFDEAIKSSDEVQIRMLLTRVEVDEQSIAAIVTKCVSND